jgi:hypothetical protein
MLPNDKGDKVVTTTEERLLRAYIRRAINISGKRKLKSLQEESKFRSLIRDMILQEAAEKVEADPHQYTGINVLRELFRNTNVLKTLREKYKTMTTSGKQRKSFRAHVITWMIDTLAPIYSLDQAKLSEAMDVDIDIISDEEKEMFIDADDGSGVESELAPEKEEEKEEEEEDNLRELPDEDNTGRNKAKQTYPTIEPSIVDHFASLDDLKDQEIFKKYLITNMKLYFDKWEKELEPYVEEPDSEEYDKVKAGPDTAGDEGEPVATDQAETGEAEATGEPQEDEPAPAGDTSPTDMDDFEKELEQLGV